MGQNEKTASSVPLVAGLLAGSVSTALLYPLDLVKVRLQVNESTGKKAATTGPLPGVSFRKRTIATTLRSVIKHEGIAGIYQGLTPALMGSAISWGGYFFFYEGLKTEMMKRKRKRKVMEINENSASESVTLGPAENFTAACASGAIMVGLTNPLWLIKTRMQLQMKRVQEEQFIKTSTQKSSLSEKIKPPYRNMWDAARTIVKEEGVLALYKGAVPALILVSHGGVQFVTYEFLKKHFGIYTKASRGDQKQRNVIERLHDSVGYLTMGAASKIIASTVTYPIQVIKSRLQQRKQTTEITATGEVRIVKREYHGVVDCAIKIWKHEGMLGFFKGTIPNALRVAPSAAITFVVYENVLDYAETKKP